MKTSSLCALTVFLLLYTAQAGAQSLSDLLEQGANAFNQGDYVTASYYLNRARDHESWADHPDKTDLYAKLAYIEESQGHFEDAAAYYRQALNALPKSDDPNEMRVAYYYQTRYANTLVRSGYYETANRIYWDLYETAELHDKSQLLQLIMENYTYQDVTLQQMDRLHNQVEAIDLMNLGWGLANLYRIQGDFGKSEAVYERIWKQNPPMATENALAMVEVYEQTGNLDDLLQETKKLFSISPQYMTFYIRLLEYRQQSESALQELETYIQTLLQTHTIPDAGILVGSIPDDLIEIWIDLTETVRDTETAAERVKQLLGVNPMNIQWRTTLSEYYVKQDQSDRAVALWKEWHDFPRSNPYQRLIAIEKIHQLGRRELASELFNRLESTVPVSLKHLEARSALEMGLYEQAISSFQVSSVSANINASSIANIILTHAGATPDRQPLFAKLIQAASGNTYTETPEWLRITLIEGAVKFDLKEPIEELIAQDRDGAWTIRLAQAAQQYGNTEWARALLENVSRQSTLRPSAEKEYIEVVSSDPSIPSQQRAADLLQPAVHGILGATEPLQLSQPQIQTLFRYMEYRLNAYQPGMALSAVQTIESSTPYLEKNLIALQLDRLKFNRARALAQLASMEPALELLHTIRHQPYRSRAQLLKARLYLALKNIEEAEPILQTLVVEREDWQLANNALAYIVAMEPLFGESLSKFFTLQLYLLQGRFEDAFPVLRSLAVDFYETDTEEWARYQIGDLKARRGDWEGAVDEWKRLLLDVDHPVYHALIRYRLTHLPKAARHLVQQEAHYEELVTEFPNTLFSDLARIQAQEQQKGNLP